MAHNRSMTNSTGASEVTSTQLTKRVRFAEESFADSDASTQSTKRVRFTSDSSADANDSLNSNGECDPFNTTFTTRSPIVDDDDSLSSDSSEDFANYSYSLPSTRLITITIVRRNIIPIVVVTTIVTVLGIFTLMYAVKLMLNA